MIPSDFAERWKKLIEEATPRAKIYEFKDHKHYFIVDLPRKSAELHGSSFAVQCKEEDEQCYIEADLVTPPELVDLVEKDVKPYGCEVEDIHRHGLLFESDHVHVGCKTSINEVEELIKYFRWF